MQSINILVAFGAGLATFFAPCTFTALPSFLSYLALSVTGGSDTKNNSWLTKHSVLFGTLIYLLGFLSVFTILGLAATQLGSFLLQNKEIFQRLGGALMIFFGLFMLVGEFIPFLQPFFYEQKLRSKTLHSPLFPFVLGLTNAFAWTPCIGPILGFILLLASSTNYFNGGTMLFAYGLGTTIPFVLLALFFNFFKDKIHKLKTFSVYVYKISAIFFIFVGLSFVFGFDQYIFGLVYRIFVNLGYSPI